MPYSMKKQGRRRKIIWDDDGSGFTVHKPDEDELDHDDDKEDE